MAFIIILSLKKELGETMSKFNSKTPQTKSNSVNMAGGKSYSRDTKKEIASVVLSSMLNGDSYYESEIQRIDRIENILKNPEMAEFIAKVMVYVRNEGNLRSVSHIIANSLAENVKGEKYLRKAFKKTFIRPDDLTEVLSLWNTKHQGKMVPNSLRRAFKDALESFSEYQLKKYEGKRNKVKLRDVVKLAHPKGDFKALIEGTLKPVQTAQTVNAGSTGEERAENYKEMLKERKLGYMAALKNIKNIIEAGADEETIDLLCALFRNEKACLNSKVLPFRFTQAYNAIKNLGMDRILNKKLVKAVEDGFILSARNVKLVEEDEKVAVLLDESGSMGEAEGSPFMIGKTLMASMLTGLDKNNTVGYLWADSAREVSVDGSPFEFIERTHTKGGGTDVWAAISGLISSRTYVDKIVVVTDMQMYNMHQYGWGKSGSREFKDMIKEYRKINPNVKVLFWNVQGYGGGTPIALNHDILEVSGFSDKLLDVVSKMWKDKDALVKEIEAIDLN